jgi:hypothetical protein
VALGGFHLGQEGEHDFLEARCGDRREAVPGYDFEPRTRDRPGQRVGRSDQVVVLADDDQDRDLEFLERGGIPGW